MGDVSSASEVDVNLNSTSDSTSNFQVDFKSIYNQKPYTLGSESHLANEKVYNALIQLIDVRDAIYEVYLEAKNATNVSAAEQYISKAKQYIIKAKQYICNTNANSDLKSITTIRDCSYVFKDIDFYAEMIVNFVYDLINKNKV